MYYIDGRTNKKYYCVDCDKEISLKSGVYGNGKCKSCSNKELGAKRKRHNYCKDCEIEIDLRAERCKSCSRTGKNNANYIDGRSFEPYSEKFNIQLKEIIRKRDNYICQNCDMTEEEHIITIGKVLTVHHIDYDKNNCEENNLITLCNQCNCRANYNRNYWQDLFENKLRSDINGTSETLF